MKRNAIPRPDLESLGLHTENLSDPVECPTRSDQLPRPGMPGPNPKGYIVRNQYCVV